MKITLIGLGKMGTAIATRIVENKFTVTVCNRTHEKTKPLVALGAQAADSIASAVKDADIIITSLIDDKSLQTISDDILLHCKSGAIHVSTSTIMPKTAKLLADKHEMKNVIYIASPLLGIPKAILAGKGMAICSGSQEAIKKVMPLLKSIVADVVNLGEKITDANVLKICMNYTIISAMELISELYVFAEKSGLDTSIVQETLHHIYAHPGVKNYIDKIHSRDFDQVNFDMRGGNKDVHLFQAAFNDVGVIPDIANMLEGKFTQALALGMENKDWSAISDIVRNRSGLKTGEA